MLKKYPPISSKFPQFLHGGDYNPDQWFRTPEIWNEDIRLMKLSNCNTMSIGIFSWSSLEPNEGEFEFDWLDTIMDNFSENGIKVILATPTGAKPAWMSQKYSEVLRVQEDRVKNLHGGRHNHCYTSSVYREKTTIINTKLAERYKEHPALIMWHISNEYGGECHCELCQYAFREWLKEKYENNLDKLNYAWWTGFWSKKITDWSQIESPSPQGEQGIHALNLDWKRFVTYQTTDFMRHEIKTIRKITPDIPVTSNFMGTYEGLDYWKMAKYIDVISWDSYPAWHNDKEKDWEIASNTSFVHDINRCLKGGQPFMMMESTPSLVNWHPANKLKRPDMHSLSSIQAVAHGSDTVQYFQWRKSRGGSEKFHGAVVDHCGHENTRVFKDVTKVGEILKKITPIVGTTVRPQVAIIFDWENRWAIDDCQALRNDRKQYLQTCMNHYRAFWKKGISVDVIDMDCDYSQYKLLVAPMLYMVRPNIAEKIENFVKNGGTLVTTYFTGMVDENDLCFQGGFPGPLRNVMGIWVEEIDTYYNEDKNEVVFEEGNCLGLSGEYVADTFCEIIHKETATVLATYKNDFYKGFPAVTVNNLEKGKAYHFATRLDNTITETFYEKLTQSIGVLPVLSSELPSGVTVQERNDGQTRFIFIMNFNDFEVSVDLGELIGISLISDSNISGILKLNGFGFDIISV